VTEDYQKQVLLPLPPLLLLTAVVLHKLKHHSAHKKF
jgi:hypothetical protein